MNRHFLRSVAFCFALLACKAFGQTITLATDDTPGDPFIIGGGDSFKEVRPGIEIEMYRDIAQKLGVTLELKRLPWNRALVMLEHGDIDGLFPASFKLGRTLIGHYPKKHAVIDISKRSRTNGYHLYQKKDSKLSWNGKEFTNLNGKSLGAHQGWAIVDDLKAMKVDVVEIPAHSKAPELILYDRVAGFVAMETVFDSYLKQNPIAAREIVKVFPPVKEKNYYLLFSKQFYKKEADLAEQFWNEIKAYQQSEYFSELVKRYIE